MKTARTIKYLLCAAAFLLTGGAAHAGLSVEIPTMRPGETKEAMVSVSNPAETTAMQFTITLPEGFTIPDGKLTLTERASGHSTEINAKGDSEYKCVIYSVSNTSFEGTEGPLFSFALQASATATSGDYTLLFSGIRFSGTDGKETSEQDVKGSVKVFIPVESISLNYTETEISRGSSLTLTATVIPENATDRSINWTSDNADVASVDASGKITANGVGTATLTATAEDGSGVSATCKVTVTPVLVSSIELNHSEYNMSIGETVKLTATLSPTDVDDSSITWSSDNTEVATVTADGTVTALAKGTAMITAKANDASGVMASCIVNIGLPNAESVMLDPTSITLQTGETTTLKATVAPAAASQAVSWTCSDTAIATVTADGTITAIAPGQATITATASDGSGKSATCSVTVLPVLVSSISLDITEIDITIGESLTLTATIAPENAYDKSVTWSSDNTEVATVTADRSVTALAEGTAVITVTANDESGVTASCTINVMLPKPVEIILSQTEVTLEKDSSVQLQASVLPSEASQDVEWISDDPETASVTQDGLVTALREGVTQIWARCKDHPEIATCCMVTVSDVSAVEINTPDNLTIKVEQNGITVSGKDADTIVEITDMEGRIIRRTNESVIRGIYSGVYIIAIDNLRIKVRI